MQQAKTIYEEILRADPRNFDALYLIGVLAMGSGNPAIAVELIDRAIAVNDRNAAAHFNRATALQQLGKLDAALAGYDRAIALENDMAEAHSNRSVVLRALGRAEAALASCERAIAIRPQFAEAHFNRGIALHDLERWGPALGSYDRAIALRPDYPEAWCNRGIVLGMLGRPEEALASYERAIALRPGYPLAYCNLGNALQEMAELEAALSSYDVAIGINGVYAEALSNRGNVLRRLDRLDEAIVSCDRATAADPLMTDAHYHRGLVLHDLEEWEAAIAAFDRAIALDPAHAEAHCNRGNSLLRLNRTEAALAAYDRALVAKPDYAAAYANRANVLRVLKRYPEALASSDRAVELEPGLAEAHIHRGFVQLALARFADVVASLDRAILLKPDVIKIAGLRLYAKLKICDWTALDSEVADLEGRILRGEPAADPFCVLAVSGSAPLQRKAAELWVRATCMPRESQFGDARCRRADRIRIGYFSSDFYNHATMSLMAGSFEMRDRSRFEMTAFSYGPNVGDAMQERMQSAADRFIDVRDRSEREIAMLARDLQIDIAVDLKGFTDDSRPGIFSWRAAPLQVAYLGYPGTSGAPYMDYLIADRVVIPDASQLDYMEKVIYLPDSYQANDHRRAIAHVAPSREELGLPREGFVFCCFNSCYKITPTVFDAWMRILRKVDGSVLWILEENNVVAANLRREAAERGVSPDRLVFARRLAGAAHLARQGDADLFLDTLPVCAHTTASDALWAGLPLLTCLGEAFAGRVAASLLQALGLPELVARSADEYEAQAVELALNPRRLTAIRRRLNDARTTAPLFDTARFTRNLERAYAAIYERYLNGSPVDHLYL